MSARRSASSFRKDIEWVPLQRHPVFAAGGRSLAVAGDVDVAGVKDKAHRAKTQNLATWHAASSRLYIWDPSGPCVHRLALRFFPCDVAVVEAASPSESIMPDLKLGMEVTHVSLNADGSSLLLAGSDSLKLMSLRNRSCSDNEIIVCRTISIGSQIYFDHNHGLQILQASWHPYSTSHLGILSSDSVFRLFDLSSDVEQPEQEYYLQAVEPGKCHNIASICPVAFSFGAQHLWERFSVFVLFSDGSIYVLCPVVPFGSFCSLEYLEEIHKDVNLFGLKSSNVKVASNASLAVSWLEATFPKLADQSMQGIGTSISRAQPYAVLDSSISLQGPLVKLSHGVDDGNSEVPSLDGIAQAVGFLYSSVGRDSVFVIAWSCGQIQFDALADEVQPCWNVDGSPRVRVDSHGNIVAIAMICESSTKNSSRTDLSQPFGQKTSVSSTEDTVWLGDPPPLLRLAIVDLALPMHAFENSSPSLYSDPLVSGRFYCLHGGGVDLIALNFLPFSNLTPEADKVAKAPSIHPILTSCITKSSLPVFSGFVITDDSFGFSQIVGITSSYECVILETKNFNDGLALHSDLCAKSADSMESASTDILSKDLLSGPKAVIVPPTMRSVTAESIEGRSTLHHYIKVLHENYVEYAHKVYIELKEHGDHVKAILNDQQKRLNEAKQKLGSFESKEASINDRINNAIQVYGNLEQRLQSFRKLPGLNKRPLSRAELELKAQLDRYADVELDVLQASIDALNARLKRLVQSSPVSLTAPRRTAARGKNYALNSQISQLRPSLERLSIINNEITDKVKLIEHELKSRVE